MYKSLGMKLVHPLQLQWTVSDLRKTILPKTWMMTRRNSLEFWLCRSAAIQLATKANWCIKLIQSQKLTTSHQLKLPPTLVVLWNYRNNREWNSLTFVIARNCSRTKNDYFPLYKWWLSEKKQNSRPVSRTVIQLAHKVSWCIGLV